MEINQKMLLDLAEQLGMSSGGKPSQAAAGAARMAGAYEGKSEEELLREIQALKSEMQADPATYRKQMQALRMLRGMMKGEQRARLDRILEILN